MGLFVRRTNWLKIRKLRRLRRWVGTTGNVSITINAATFSCTPASVKGNTASTITSSVLSFIPQALKANTASTITARAMSSWAGQALKGNTTTTIAARAMASWVGQTITFVTSTVMFIGPATFAFAGQAVDTFYSGAGALYNWIVSGRRRGRRR